MVPRRNNGVVEQYEIVLLWDYTVVLKSDVPKSDAFLKFSRNSEKI